MDAKKSTSSFSSSSSGTSTNQRTIKRFPQKVWVTDSLVDPESEENQEEPEEVKNFHPNISEIQVEDSRRFAGTTECIDCCATTAIIANVKLLTDVNPRR